MTSVRSTPPLLLHLVFHPGSPDSRELAHRIHRALNDDTAVQGLRVPTVFCREQSGQPPPIEDIEETLREGQRSFVLPLADKAICIHPEWKRYFAELWLACQRSDRRCVPVQLVQKAWPLDSRLEGTNFLRAVSGTAESRFELILRRLLIELCRFLEGETIGDSRSEAPITMFISHTKLDVDNEPRVVHRIVDTLNATQPIRTWFDSGDIDAGSLFEAKIREGVQNASLLCVLTDNYASREWCRREVLLAKREHRPIVVIDAITTRELRSFPYLGNLPVLRWNDNAEEAIMLLLKETLRQQQVELTLDTWREEKDRIFTRPPELLTLAEITDGTTVLYPDPPLGAEEISALGRLGTKITTPLERLARKLPLQGKSIAISMSESTDIRRFGLDEVHFEATMLELSRYLLVKGACLAYGGHLGSAGYTVKLIELVRSHNERSALDDVELIRNYIGWPLPYDDEVKYEYGDLATLVRTDRPDGVDETLHADLVSEPAFFPAERSPEHRYAWARGMSAMRSALTKDTIARVVVGGTFGPTLKAAATGGMEEKWYASRIPGVIEEILLSLQAEQPLFLVGAFGGAARLVIDLLEGDTRPEMTWDFQSGAPHAREMRAIYEARGEEWWDYEEMARFIREKGIPGVNPHLSQAENRELFHTRNVHRMVELIVLGLDRIHGAG